VLAWLAVCFATAFVAAGAWVYFTLPDVASLKARNPPRTALMALRDRQYREAGKVPPRRQTWVPLRAVSPHLVNAVLMAEDTAFYQHDGVDYHEVWESIKLDWREKRLSRGASTITQQLARTLYLSPERSPLRKFRELLIARRLEAHLSKSRILELYLNVVEWGRNIYGAEAAAQVYFHVPAGDLTPAQSALLAGMLINPIRYSPLAPSTRLARRKQIILGRMVRFGRISHDEYRVAMGLKPSAPPPPEPSEEEFLDEGAEDEPRGPPPLFKPEPPLSPSADVPPEAPPDAEPPIEPVHPDPESVAPPSQ